MPNDVWWWLIIRIVRAHSAWMCLIDLDSGLIIEMHPCAWLAVRDQPWWTKWVDGNSTLKVCMCPCTCPHVPWCINICMRLYEYNAFNISCCCCLIKGTNNSQSIMDVEYHTLHYTRRCLCQQIRRKAIQSWPCKCEYIYNQRVLVYLYTCP